MQVSKILKTLTILDVRAPYYENWDLNEDILVHYKPLYMILELSSMSIRVNAKSLEYQLRWSI